MNAAARISTISSSTVPVWRIARPGAARRTLRICNDGKDRAGSKGQGAVCARRQQLTLVGAIHERDDLPWCEDAEALDHQLARLVPIGVGVEHHPEGITAPTENEKRIAGLAQKIQLLALRAERQHDQWARVGDLDAQDVGERAVADPPPYPNQARSS